MKLFNLALNNISQKWTIADPQLEGRPDSRNLCP